MFTLSHQELERFETWPAYPSPMRRLVQRQTWQEEELNAASDELREMYLETIKNCLCDSFHFDRASAARRPVTRRFSWSLKGLVRLAAAAALKKQGIGLYHEANPDDPPTPLDNDRAASAPSGSRSASCHCWQQQAPV